MSAIKIKHPGLLHEELHVKKGSKIPRGKIRANLRGAKKRGDVAQEKRDVFALNFGKRK